MSKPLTVGRSLYALLKKNGGKVNKSIVLEWEVPYEYKGKRFTANGDTKARTLRHLVEEGWLGQEEKNGQAFYWSKTDNDTVEIIKEESTLPSRPVAMRKDGERPVGVPPEKVESYKANGYSLL